MKLPHIPGYEIQDRLGGGAAGMVYLARDEALDREVAIKVYRFSEEAEAGQGRARFAREARLFGQLRHEAILPVLAADLDHDPPYLVFRLLRGGDLRGEIGRGAATPRRVAEVGLRLARGLQCLHDAGILHRDIKPGNVLLDAGGLPYLADLGLGQAEEEAALTRTNHVVGSPLYMAPEIFERGEYSQTSDVYALTATLLELVLGELPGKPGQVYPFTDRVEVPALRGILRRGLRELPRNRTESAARLARDLEGFLGAQGAQSARAPVVEDATRTATQAPLSAPPPASPPDLWPAAPPRPPLGRVVAAALVLLAGSELLVHLGAMAWGGM